jgi:uncharacterized repeat protein (TIGR03803 family)
MSSIRTNRGWAAVMVAAILMMLAAAIAAPAQTYDLLYTFNGVPNGSDPLAGLIQDAQGNLYGTTFSGGTYNVGTVFKIDSTGAESVLYNFTGGADGSEPFASLIQDSVGNLYGTTFYGGITGSTCSSGCGVVFKVDPTGKETVLYAFQGGADGANPEASLIRDGKGNLYGTTFDGGSGCDFTSGCGTLFRLDVTGRETVLHSFQGGSDGIYPEAPVIRDDGGNLYGTTVEGGMYGWGALFKVDVTSRETVLYNFTGGADGGYPFAPLARDTTGSLYGTTFYGGPHGIGGNGFGVVFRLDTTGSQTVLHAFTGGSDGANPRGGLLLDTAGNLFGTTEIGGDLNCTSPYGKGCGTVFALTPQGTATVLHEFTGGNDGGSPYAGLVHGTTGNFYGTTTFVGGSTVGTVFEIIRK